MKKRSVILTVFLAFLMIALLPTNLLSAGPQKPPPTPDPTQEKLDQIINKLNQLPPTWSQIIPSAGDRFVLVMDGTEAVLDRETGLVWSRYVPYTSTANLGSSNFFNSIQICHTAMIGGRWGWRLPTVEELFTLMDPNSSNHLPPGNPFIISFSQPFFWTSTTEITSQGVEVGMAIGPIGTDPLLCLTDPKETIHQIWCVRGGYGPDGVK